MTLRMLGKMFKGANFSSPSAGFATLIAPVDNPYGIILRSLNSGQSSVVINATTPVVTNPTAYLNYLTIPSGFTDGSDLSIPAGKGLYVIHGDGYNSRVFMSWDVLNADGAVA